MKNRLNTEQEPDFVSRQVTEARRYYLNLNPLESDPLSVVCGGVERMRADYVVERDRFSYYGIELVVAGSGELTLDDQIYQLSPGMMFAYGPQTPHRIANKPPEQMRKYYVDIAGSDAEKMLQQAGLFDSHPLRVPHFHEISELFEMLDREAHGNGDTAGEICEQIVRLMLVKARVGCLEESPTTPRAFATYERVRSHIDENFLTLNTIEEVAAQCELTPIHLSRLFRRFAATGAYQYLLRKKMNRAAELLVEDQLLVKQVAHELGFSDAFQFSRAFKRVFGIPPKHIVASQRTPVSPEA